jgi:hydroxymethylbilane synthase
MPENRKIRIGTRGSDLALWQANFVKHSLEKLGEQVEIQIIHTQGDKIQDLSFDKLEGKGFFTKEIEQALLEKQVDLAVHSHKDLETTSPEGLTIAAVSDREDPSELLLIRKESVDQNELWNLKQNAVIGTSSARRKSQILAHRIDLSIKDLRGNVPTRINKLREGQYDAILLAKAGVNRLEIELSDLHCETLSSTEFIPAPAQGVLGLQIRSEDIELSRILAHLNHQLTQAQIEIERGVLRKMEGGCQLPLGVYCDGETIHVSYSKNSSVPASYFVFDNRNQDVVNEIIEHLKSI